MTEPGAALVTVKDLEFAYGGGFRLQLASFQLEPGERVAILGPSGSGKTTLLALLAGILLPDRGAVCWGQVTVRSLKDSQRRARRLETMGLIFQEFELLQHLSALDNILLPQQIRHGRQVNRKQALGLADAAGIQTLMNRVPKALSHGERQRVALCRALAGNPRLVLADEPTASLDAQAKERAVRLLRQTTGAGKAGLILVTHDESVIQEFDRVLSMPGLCEIGS